MDESKKKMKEKFEVNQALTFPVPLALEEIKDNNFLSFNTNREEIINQALKFHSEGNLKKAIQHYQYLLEKGISDYRVFSNLGVILKDYGKLKKAEIYTRRAIDLKPNYFNANINLANILKDLRKYNEAEFYIYKAIKLRPDCADAYYNLGGILRDRGNYKEALKAYNKALFYKPNDLAIIFNSKLFLSSIPFNQKQISLERSEFIKQMVMIKNEKNIVLNNNFNFGNSIFYLAFHGQENDKEILIELGNILSKVDGIINHSFDKNKQIESYIKRNKIRLGVCSEFLYSHSVNNFFGNIIKSLASSGIEIVIFRPPNSKYDNESKLLDSVVTKAINLPNSLNDGCTSILNESIDILLYLDIGMSNYTYLLSLSRLALVQVNALGHSNTSGSPNIDYAISCRDYDIEGSEKHFSEQIIRLSRLPVNYSIPKFATINFNRSEFDIPKEAFLIGLPHTLFKYHPDFDLILDRILEEIPNAIYFCAEGLNEFETEKLKKRWGSCSKKILNRTIFHRRVSPDKFFAILRDVDIVLSPFYFGMGNTYYQAMSVGTPVVTYTQDIFRTRHAYVGYKQMGIVNPPVAYSPEEYISICKKLAFNKKYRESIENQILSKSKQYLFNDKTIHKEYIQFFKSSLEAAKSNSFLPNHWESNPQIVG